MWKKTRKVHFLIACNFVIHPQILVFLVCKIVRSYFAILIAKKFLCHCSFTCLPLW